MNTHESKFDRNSPDYEMWAHAACLTLAEGNKDYPPIELQSPAIQAVIKLADEVERLRAEIAYSQQRLAAAQLTIQVVRMLIKPIMPPTPEDGLSDTEYAFQSGRNQVAQYIRDGIDGIR